MPDFIDQLRLRLLELGCPVGRMRRMIQEVADHREDLTEAGRSQGLSELAARAQAETRLGNPYSLAEDLMVSLRRSTWCGRHAFVTFVLLPLLLFPVFWMLVLFLGLSAEFALVFGWDYKALHAAADNPVVFHRCVWALQGADYVAVAAVFAFFCLLARRSAIGLKWIMSAGLICAVYALFIFAHVVPHNFSIGMTFKPQWTRAVIPLLLLGTVYWNRRRLVRGAIKAPVPAV